MSAALKINIETVSVIDDLSVRIQSLKQEMDCVYLTTEQWFETHDLVPMLRGLKDFRLGFLFGALSADPQADGRCRRQSAGRHSA